MFLSEMQRVIDAFKRFMELDGEYEDLCRILAIGPVRSSAKGWLYPVKFTYPTYSLVAWLDVNDELHIINPDTRESVFDYAEEQGWSDEDVQYIRFGESYGKTIHEDGTYTNYAYGKKVKPSPDFMNLPE